MRDFGLLYVNAMRVRCLDCICVCCKWCFTMWALGQHQNHNLLFTHCLTFCIYREPKRKKKKKKRKSQLVDLAFIKAASLIILSKPKCWKETEVCVCLILLPHHWVIPPPLPEAFTPCSLLPSYWSNPVISHHLIFHLPGFVLKVFVSAHQPLEYGSCLVLVNFL